MSNNPMEEAGTVKVLLLCSLPWEPSEQEEQRMEEFDEIRDAIETAIRAKLRPGWDYRVTEE